MSAVRLTPKRRAALDAIAAGWVNWPHRGGPRTHDGSPLDSEAVRWLLRTGLATLGAFDSIDLTPEGSEVLHDARDTDEFNALPRQVLLDLGAGVRKRYGPSPPGRNVVCSACGQTGPHTPVWWTNESGTAAERDAQRALRNHVLAHVRGTL